MPSKEQNLRKDFIRDDVKEKKEISKPSVSTNQNPASIRKQPLLPVEVLQTVLNVFKNTFSSRFDLDLPRHIQQVKQHLYNRDFDLAFGQDDFLKAYAVRWSPSRALAYTNIFCTNPIISESLLGATLQDESLIPGSSSEIAQHNDVSEKESNEVVCIGAGGGAEVVALGVSLKYLESRAHSLQIDSNNTRSLSRDGKCAGFCVKAIDLADWASIVADLHADMHPSLPSLSDMSMKSTSVEQSSYKMSFKRQNVLKMELSDLAMTFTGTRMVTLMFALNELYSNSMTDTTNFLLALTMITSTGTLLLVIDSPGSYSTVKLGGDPKASGTKKYPMQWLLDHTLLKSAAISSSKNSSEGADQWEKLENRESEWFRLPKSLTYPISLEDMRYQMHLYRRL